MEPITLCGAVIVAFGLWIEFEPILMKVAGVISKDTIGTNRYARSPAARAAEAG